MSRCAVYLKAAVALAGAITAIHSYAFPIEPVPLRILIEQSDLIVFAKVEPPRAPPRKATNNQKEVTISLSGLYEDYLGKSPARLRPLSLLKGTPPPGLIEVHFNPNMVCPMPPRFPANSNVMAFLVTHAASNGFRTVGLHYGAKLLSDQDASAYARLIKEYLQILPERDRNKRSLQTTEWLVQCVEDPVTRYEGVMELVDRTGMLRQEIKSQFAPLLSVSQITRLSNTLFSAELPTNGSLNLTPLFKNSAKPQLAALYIRYLESAAKIMHPTNSLVPDWDSFPEPWNVYDVILEAADLLESSETKALLKNDKCTDYFSATYRTKRASQVLPLLEQAAAKKRFPHPVP